MATRFSARRPLTDNEEEDIQRSIAADPDNPELTDAQLSKGRPFREALPDLASSIDQARRRGRPPVEIPRQQISLRLDPDIIAHYKATGNGWQSRLNDDLRKAAKL
jgi:uncharacterized protein (DUF4415 family)